MKFFQKKSTLLLFIIVATFFAGYGGYRLYNYVVDITIERIRTGVTKGLRKSILDSINPLKWPGKLFKKSKPKEPTVKP